MVTAQPGSHMTTRKTMNEAGLDSSISKIPRIEEVGLGLELGLGLGRVPDDLEINGWYI